MRFIATKYSDSTFGEYIRKVRLEKGLFQKDVARLAGLDEMTICNWEKLEGFPKRYIKVRELCLALSLNYEELLKEFHPLWRESSQASGIVLIKGRITLGLTQKDSAKLAGVDPVTLGRWERYPETPPEWMRCKLERLEEVLGVPVVTA